MFCQVFVERNFSFFIYEKSGFTVIGKDISSKTRDFHDD